MKLNLLFLTALFAIVGLNASAQTQLWGTCVAGGATDSGTIFMANADGSNLHTVYNFVNATGAWPLGGLALANNGKFYGVTREGGYNDSCVVFSYDAATGVYTDIHDLAQYPSLGYIAFSGMIKVSDGMLYGLCSGGGANNTGVIFKIDPATDTYTDIHDFNAADGSDPYGSLTQLSDGKLYGMTFLGGPNGAGTIFSFDPSTTQFTTLHSFINISGGQPYYGSLIEATNGSLYGMTYYGGANNAGVIFSYDPAINTYNELYAFDNTSGGHPYGSLMQATDGNLYGMTSSGGSNGDGVIFRFNINTSVYTDLLYFNGTNGSSPRRSLIQGSTGKLYGTTYVGGTYSSGVVFSYDINTSTYTKLVDFNSTTTGAGPDCELIEIPAIVETGI